MDFFHECKYKRVRVGKAPCVVAADVLNYQFVLCEFELQSRNYVRFQTNTLQLLVKYYPCCSSTRMPLALNNPRRLICIKQRNQTKPTILEGEYEIDVLIQ